MKIEEILIFKTPLDSSYSNVYDGYSSKNEYYSFLLTNFETAVIYSYDIGAKRKSVNLNKKIDLQVNLNDVSVRSINDYNYCCITAENGDKYFYFIDNYKINNSVGYEATLYCTWDSWSNNYSKLWEQNSNNEFIETRHIDEYNIVEDITTHLETKNFITDEEEFPLIDSIENITDDKYEVLYARIFCRSETFVFGYELYHNDNPEGVFWRKWGCAGAMHSVSPLKVVYTPLCVIDKSTRKIAYEIKNYKVWFTTTDGTYTYRQSKDFELEFTKYQWFVTSKLNEIIYADLTFNLPYPYSFRKLASGETILEYGYDINEPIFKGNFSSYFGGYGGTTDSDTEPSGYGFAHSKFYVGENKEFDLTINRIPTHLDNKSISELMNSKDYNDRYENEPHMFVYPNYFYSLVIGNNTIPLIGEENTKKINFSFDYINTTSPKLWFKNDNNNNYKLKPLYSKSIGQIIVQVDSLAEYMQSNANQVNQQYLNNALNFSVSAIGGAIKRSPTQLINSGVNFVENSISIKSKLKDIDNKRDSVSIPSTYALDDVYYQDSIIILHNEIEDSKDKETALNKYVLYGLNVNRYGNIFQNTRHNFDFVKTSNCELNRLQISNYDKNIIKNMFNNGVRKWHITGHEIAIKNFDTDYVNLQNSVLEVYPN